MVRSGHIESPSWYLHSLVIAAVLLGEVSGEMLKYRDGDYPEHTQTGTAKRTRIDGLVSNQSNAFSDYAYNPVLQNIRALEEIMQNERPRKVNLKTFATHYPDGTRRKRSLVSLWCGSGDQCSLSLCPWEERMDIQTTRTPLIIKYAVCRSRGCDFSSANAGQNVNDLLDLHTSCDVVRTDIQVKEDGIRKWLTDWPIACICVRRHLYPEDETDYLPNSPVERPVSRKGIEDKVKNRHKQSKTRKSKLVRQYQRQLKRRKNIESFDVVMARRQRERKVGGL